MKLLSKCIALCCLVCSFSFADFIQSPIPPSSKQNFFLDTDVDGRMDQISIRFLGTISRDYLDNRVDSLVFDWINTNGVLTNYVVQSSSMDVDSANPRQILVNLRGMELQFQKQTSLVQLDFENASYGNVKLYVADSVVYSISMRDAMSPQITSAYLKSYQGEAPDTLTVSFSENVKQVEGCNDFFEFKSAEDSVVRILPTGAISWNSWKREVILELQENDANGVRFSTRDSLRLLNGCVTDSSKNVSYNAPFFPMSGSYPIQVKFPSIVVDNFQDEPTSIFQLEFSDAEEDLQDSMWRISVDVMGPEFENALRDILKVDRNTKIDPSKLIIQCNVKIYTNLGTYVTGTTVALNGSDERFEFIRNRLSLRWNLMDSRRRRVSTGAYLANVHFIIDYDGQVVYRGVNSRGSSMHVFGVKRH